MPLENRAWKLLISSLMLRSSTALGSHLVSAVLVRMLINKVYNRPLPIIWNFEVSGLLRQSRGPAYRLLSRNLGAMFLVWPVRDQAKLSPILSQFYSDSAASVGSFTARELSYSVRTASWLSRF